MTLPDLEIETAPARGCDVAETAGVLARAFTHDPSFAWHLPHTPSRQRRLYRYFATLMAKEALPLGVAQVARVSGRIVGATVWKPPNRWRPSLATQLSTLPGYLACYRGRSLRALASESVLFKEHPREPHWYLYVIGTEPDLQGRGIGAALLRCHLGRCDAEGTPAYLESSSLTNVPLYRHFGFEPLGLLGLPASAPPVTKMWRVAGCR
jgi:GNAT superfamily N-acetyltransferase